MSCRYQREIAARTTSRDVVEDMYSVDDIVKEAKEVRCSKGARTNETVLFVSQEYRQAQQYGCDASRKGEMQQFQVMYAKMGQFGSTAESKLRCR
jgi:hypothetical protein